jgi:regulator of protease activity HflC (stomatin/prohibitin superfamily)
MNDPELHQDRYRGVAIVLFAAAVLGAAGAVAGGIWLSNPVLLAVAVMLGMASGVLAGVFVAQAMRLRPPVTPDTDANAIPKEPPLTVPEDPNQPAEPVEVRPTIWTLAKLQSLVVRASRETGQFIRDRGILKIVRLGTAVVGANAICLMLLESTWGYPLYPLAAGIGVALCLVAAGIAATAVRYLNGIDPAEFPESPALCRGGRATAWILVLAAVSVVLQWAEQRTILQVLYFSVVIVDVAFCYGLFVVRAISDSLRPVFPLDIGVLSVLGSRANIFGSILDSAERQLGIDLRSTWALSVIRRSIEPLVLGLALVAWLSTSLTVVGIEEQGLVERLGVPVGGPPLFAGLHVHLPWPVDKVLRIPVRRVQVLEVGHEGNEAPGPENVLWAVEHAPNEFTLLLGNGRDLITVDAGVQFRIVNAAAWRYHCQNPAEALSAIAYRAVMRNTVNLTLSDALSQNVTLLTQRMRGMIQREADALGLGVEILGFTVGGMHPPVAVARDYQAVVSAELRKVTAVVNARVFRARTLPESEATVLTGENGARAEGAEALGKAAGEAWSFRALESQYRASPNLYFYRRRLETLEKGLADRDFTIVDHRFQRDGGELWLNR